MISKDRLSEMMLIAFEKRDRALDKFMEQFDPESVEQKRMAQMQAMMAQMQQVPQPTEVINGG
jgi:hypothetical protein